MFYTNIVNEIRDALDQPVTTEDLVSPSTLGSILECHVKGLYSYEIGSNNLYSYRLGDAEVDIFDFLSDKLIEVSVSNKSNDKLHFDKVPDYIKYKKILLTRDIKETSEIVRIPYPEYNPN